MSKDEEEEREEALAEVADPMFLMLRGDADADGDIEVDDGAGGHMMTDSYISVS
jgi:RNA polymerase II-associated factor 1